VMDGVVRYAPAKSFWLTATACAAVIGGAANFSVSAFGMFIGSTGMVLLLGHSLGSHRKLIHNSFQCPLWLEYLLVYLGVQTGLAGPLACCASMNCATTRNACRPSRLSAPWSLFLDRCLVAAALRTAPGLAAAY
jgi:hypothetical protein